MITDDSVPIHHQNRYQYCIKMLNEAETLLNDLNVYLDTKYQSDDLRKLTKRIDQYFHKD